MKTTLEKDIAPNYALLPIITAHLKATSSASASSVSSASPVHLTPSVATGFSQTISVPVPSSPPRPIVGLDQLNERLHQLTECQSYLRIALNNLPVSVSIQQTQIIGQFNLLRQAIEQSQTETLQNLAALQVTVSAQLQQELLICDSHLMEVQLLRDEYPASVAQSDVNHWIEAEDVWRSRLAIMQQHGLLGAFSAQVPLSIAAPTLTYEGHSIDFPALWAISRDAANYLNAVKTNKPLKPIHLITQSASGMIRRWDFRDRITISEVNHPGLRSWSLFEKGSKLVAASAKIKVYDTFTGQCLATFESLSSSAKRIVASGCELKARAISFHVNQGTAALWDLYQNIRLNWDMDISAWNTSLVVPIAVDSHFVLVPTIAFPFNVLLFNLVTGDVEEGKHLEGFQTDVVDIIPYGDGRFCVTLCTGGACAIWDLQARKVLKSAVVDSKHKQLSILKLNKKAIASGKLPVVAAFSTLSGSISVWNPVADHVNLITHNGSTMLSSSMRSVLVFDAGRMALSAHANGKVHVWDLTTGQCTDTLPLSVTGQFILCNKGHNILVGTPNGYLNVIDSSSMAISLSSSTSSAPPSSNTNAHGSHIESAASLLVTSATNSSSSSNSVLQLLPSALDGSGIQLHLIGTLQRS